MGGTLTGATGLSTSFRYSDSGNSWASRTNMNFIKYGNTAMQLTSNTALSACGYNGTSQGFTERYNDGETYFKGFAIK